jgi:predicted RNase H-like nuclease (RuvC/YqgF family)
VQLIQDLNQCNDALLLRVTELEDDLERSQVALQAEIERNQAQPGALPAVATPGPVQQQIAQLLSELDIANDGLRRTTIHNETLQAELEVNQQRVAQLERECTLLQQRFSEKNTALHQAEETCRDLKARLHRQQRYTLQFKAALERCLNMSPAPATASPAAIQGQLLPP